MTDWRKELNHCREIASLARRAGDSERAVTALRRAADILRVGDEMADDADRARARGEVCGELGELLWDAQLPHAVQAYQEAADAFGKTSLRDRRDACARKVVEGVRLLRFRPTERLDLLIAQFDRSLRETGEQPDGDQKRADLLFKVGTVLQRRDRFREAADRYGQSLAVYVEIDGRELEQAKCHHRLGDLYHHELKDSQRAILHYRSAIDLYSAHEPEWEGEQMNRTLCEWHLKEISDESGRDSR